MHLFAGVGGGLLADLILGHTPAVAVEWDKYACRVLRERAADGWFPDLSVREGDVRLFDPSEYAGRMDCIHAGFPCQDISVAGKQAGLGEGTRSGLYREVLRIAGMVRPRYLFLENVSAIISNGLGSVLGDLAEMGYGCRWLCIRASDVGAPHRRDRWFCLAELANADRDDGSKGTRESITECARHAQARFFSEPTREGGDNEGRESGQQTERQGQEDIGGGSEEVRAGWWAVESEVGRVAYAVPNRIHRLKGLGGAQVPLQAATAWRILTANSI